MQYHSAIRVNSVFSLYAMYESVRGVYDPVRATYRFFYGVYGVVCGVFRIVHGVFRIFLFNSEKVEKGAPPRKS